MRIGEGCNQDRRNNRLCASIQALIDTSTRLRVNDVVECKKGGGEKDGTRGREREREERDEERDGRMETRYQKHPKLTVHYLRLARTSRISLAETSAPSAS